MLFHEELFTKSSCVYCSDEITGLGIQCAECHNGKMILCLECFSLGAEIGQHKSDHKFRYFDSGSLVLGASNTAPRSQAASSGPRSAPCTATSETPQDPDPVPGPSTSASASATTPSTSSSAPTPGPSSAATASSSSAPTDTKTESPKWTAREEIRLLDAIEQYGFGNWEDISKHIETKTPAEAKTHYVDRYVNGILGQLTWATDVSTEVNKDICNVEIQKPIDHTVPSDDGPLSPSLTQRLPPLDITQEEMVSLGYMPQRDDYEKEFDNEAETLVSNLSFSPDDDELEIGLKLALVDIYSRRLRERARRKRMIRDYQLVSKFFKKDKPKAGESSSTKPQFVPYEKNLQDKFRPFAQFMNSKEHDNLIRNLVKEQELKFRLTELYKYRKAGIRRPDECAEYERLLANAAVGKGKRGLETVAEGESQETDEGRSCNKMAQAQVPESLVAPLLVRQLQQAIPPNSPKMKPPMSVGSDESASVSPSAALSLTQQLFSSDDSSLRSYMESSESAHVLLQQDLLDEQKVLMEVLQRTENSSQQSEKLKDSAGLFTAEYAPSSDLLTEKEFQFCLKTTITPAQFLTIKTALLLARKPKIDSNQQCMELKDIPCPPNITSEEWEQVITFFKTNYI